MPLKELLKETQKLGELIFTATSNDSKRNKKDRHVNYRTKRLAELTVIWNNYNQKLTELKEALSDPDDPCVVEAENKYKDAYEIYKERLMTIPNDDNGQQNPSDSEEDDDNNDIKNIINMQWNRLNKINQFIFEVKAKQDNNEVPLMAYITIKMQRIQDLWKKIENDDDCIDPGAYPYYKDEMNKAEKLVEESLIFLQSNIPTSSGQKSEGLKLNRVEIQKFSGDYFKWITFRDLFDSMVVQNKNLSKVQKMQMLKTNLTGEAETLIGDLTVSEANFDSAWDRLMHRFNNNRVVVYKLLTKLINQSPCKGESKSVKKLLDTTDQLLLALKNMNRPTSEWDDWIIVTLTQKLSEDIHKDWEKHIGNSDQLPTWIQLKEFLEERYRMLERLESSHKRPDIKQIHQTNNQGKSLKAFQTTMSNTCIICEESHSLYSCQKWKEMSPKDRLSVVKKQKWCKRCLRSHEDKQKCEKVCKKCKKGHSTWLHENRSENDGQLTIAHGTLESVPHQTLLATAVIKVFDIFGHPIMLRALIDSGAEGSLITERAAALIKAKPIKTEKWLQGLAGRGSKPLQKIHIKMEPRFNSDFFMEVDVYILKSLTKMLPGHDLNPTSWKHIQKLVWADPYFHKSGPIDALLGMDTIVEILKPRIIKGITGQPMAQETHLGWIMSGKIDPTYPTNNLKCFVARISDVNHDLTKFWEVEELHPQRTLTHDEIECEKIYESTVNKHNNGQFIISIPFKNEPEGPERLGESKGQAIARFLQVEKRLARDRNLGMEYERVLQEYIDLGHMTEVTTLPQEDKKYYIPHHAVVKPDRLTTKVRVVFDASAKTSTGWSLNECMYTGSKQQRELTDILMNWRMFRYVYKADIEKMYRMILLTSEDQKYHTIIWRKSHTEPLKEYQMTTTTFGTAAAPFLATRTLGQIAQENKDTYPLASEALVNHFYVDDLIGGNHSLNEAVQCKNELFTVLDKHKFSLRKWTSNSYEFLENLPPKMTEKSLQIFSEDDTSKALGLLWNPQSDQFLFKINWIEAKQTTWTKRQFLAESSKLFDPLGWLAPITINAKILMQEIWLSKIGWDDLIPQEIAEKWTQFRQEFTELENIKIDRWIKFEPGCELSLHGFCDASEKAYSAAIYVRIRNNHEIKTHLIAAKTRVAPVRAKITLPRLELCGAVLVSSLMNVVRKSLNIKTDPIFLWTDSMITLGWLNREPNKWKTFVANRVAEVRENQLFKWNYVPTDQNPADCASRGLMPLELINHSLWWTGPKWLKEEPNKWPTSEIPEHNLEQRNKLLVNLTLVSTNDIVSKISSWYKLRRIAAYGLRFKNKQTGTLSVTELRLAEEGLIKSCQEEAFYQEMDNLANNQPINKKSKLKSLNIFLDEKGILRVGGRLMNASISYEAKHPIILPAGKHLTKIIIHQMHIDTHHGGPQLMRSLLMRKYWIIQGKRMIHSEFSKCVVCRKFKGESYKQQMGNLPPARVTLARAFGFTGIDYAGPIEVKSSNLRSARIQKGYIAVYVCMGTKAVHLELVSDQTTEAFLASFNRFTARRGLPTEMYSDNGSNFEGADNQLQRMYLLQQNKEIAKTMVNNNVEWHFIPPGAPNFGGLWERSVRSMKDHIKRTLKTARLTFEEYATLLCQVEACMNSRPLCSLSDDIDNLEVLTPGHFLIGQALIAPPQLKVGIKLSNHRNRWIYVQTLHQQLWERWNTEYLIELQQRHKWQENSENAKTGDLVAVKDEDMAPRNWLVGKIEEVHTGNDGNVRVATIRVPVREKIGENDTHLFRPNRKNRLTKTKDSQIDLKKEKHMKSKLIQRPIRKLCPLITDNKEMEMIQCHVNRNSNKEKQPTTKKSYNLRPRASHLITFALIFFGFIIGSAATTSTNCIEKTQFEYNAGIYFENLGRACITKSEWNIIVYFGLDKFNNELELIDDSIKHLDNLCKQSETSISEISSYQCTHTIALLKSQFNEILEMNDILRANKQAINHRNKRAAPLNAIGWIGHQLFGIMDASSAEKIEQQIADCKDNFNYLQNLLDQQTSVIELTNNLLKDSIEVSEKKFEILTNAVIKLSNETELYRKREQIIGWALYMSLIINRVEKTQHNMINMLTDLQQGHVSSYLFTPKQFKKELDEINDRIPNGQKLPVNPQHDMRSFYEIMRGRMRVTENKILLEIILPLVSIEDFQIFHIIPIPIQHENEHICIIPESPYLLITLKQNFFYQIKELEINKCIKPQGVPIICNPTQPMNSIESTKSKCERKLLAGERDIKNCQIQVNPITETWIQLKTENKWIYNLPKQITLNMIQTTNAATTTLQGSGILDILPGCEIHHNGLTISGKSRIITNNTLDFQPMLNLSDLMQQNKTEFNIVNITVDNSVRFREINSKISQLRNSTHSQYKTQTLLQHSLTFSLILVAMIFIIWKGRHSIKLAMKKLVTRRKQNYQLNQSIAQQDGQSRLPISADSSLPISVDNSNNDPIHVSVSSFNTDDRHGPGGCPFRT